MMTTKQRIVPTMILLACGACGPHYLYPTPESQELRELCRQFYTRGDLPYKEMVYGDTLDHLQLEGDTVTYYFESNRSFTVQRTDATDLQPGSYSCL